MRALPSERWSAFIGFAIVVLFFCAPLFYGLDRFDQRNDEAIYSYAVDRILETGEWLTPRAIYSDQPFLEKPPLKFWLVAAPMKLGLLPFDDLGMRFIDALFGGAIYLYVFAIGRRLGGTLAGVVAAFLTFSYDPLIYWHGIRENNMEGALVLAYCGGMYHFASWAEAGLPVAGADATGLRRRRAHALAFSGYFVLGFMTKFLAGAFLPLVCLIGALLRRDTRSRWREWLAPVLVAAAAIVPWFVYQSIHAGREFTNVIFFEHIYQRFTATLIPSHVNPWPYYFTQTWKELGYSSILVISLCGAAALVLQAWRGNWLAQVLVVWWLVPLSVMSLGTSKLFYYAHPFFPPVAVGGGLAASMIFAWGNQGRALMRRIGLRGRSDEQQARRRASPIGRSLAAIGVIAFAVALWTLIHGPFAVTLGGVRVFSNASVARPIVIGALALYFGGIGSLVFELVGMAVLAVLLPISDYDYRVSRFATVEHPIRAARDCALSVQATGAQVGRGVFDAAADIHHAYFYYLRRLGAWSSFESAPRDELQRRLERPGEQTPVLISAEDYARLGGKLVPNPAAGSRPGVALSDRPASWTQLERGLPAGATINRHVVMLFPGPFGVCAGPVARAGAEELTAALR